MKLKIMSLMKDGTLETKTSGRITVVLKKEGDLYHALLEHNVDSLSPAIHFHKSFSTKEEADRHYADLCNGYAR